MARDRAEVRRAAACSCAAGCRSRAIMSSPTRVVAHERDAPVRRTPRVAGLPMSWNSAAKRSAWPRVSSSASGSSSTARTRGASSSPKTRSRSRSSPISSLQHLERVAVDVGVVEVALLDAVQRRRARAGPRAITPRSSASVEAVEHAVGAARAGAARRRCARGAASVTRGAARAGGRSRVGVGLEVELGGEPRRAAAGAAGRARRRSAEHAQHARARGRAAPPCGSIGSPPASGTAIALTAKSRLREVVLDRRRPGAASGRTPGAVGGEHAPGAELVGQREDGPPRALRRSPRAAASARRRRSRGRRRRRRGRAARRARCRRRSRPRRVAASASRTARDGRVPRARRAPSQVLVQARARAASARR